MKKMSKNLIVLAVGLGVLLNPNALSILSPDFTASAKETRVEVINVVPVQTTKGVHLTWSSTGFADYYEVIRMNNYKVEQSYTTRDKDVFDPDVEPGVYEYLVIPYRNGLPALSGYARFEVLDLKKQVAIIDLRVNKKDNNVALRWSSGGNPDEIVITRKRGNVQEIEHTVKGSLTSFKDPSPLKPGQYNYLITPFKKGKPGISEEAVVTVEGDSIEEDIQILNLTAQPTKDGIFKRSKATFNGMLNLLYVTSLTSNDNLIWIPS